MTQRIQSIVIVGGGTAGWLTAGIIAARHQGRMKTGFTVTLVESPTVPIIGVGEGTWPTLRFSLQKMGVSETAFFRNCNAAFKQGAKFVLPQFCIGQFFGAMAATARLGEQIRLWIQLHAVAAYRGG